MTWIKPQLFQWQDRRTFWLGLAFAATLSFSLIACLLWLSFANLEESITGYGQIIPIGKVRRVMAPIDGIVTKVYVQEDSHVEAEQILMELNPEITDVEEEELQRQLSYLNDEVHALKAALGDGKFNGLSKSNYGQLQSDWLASIRKAYESKLAGATLQIGKSEHLYKGECYLTND